ncbi:cytochrome bd-type quinol oxidase subunit 2 [Streptosporangium becharense]|uniref:Cytochrome bd-type quinol oxidase subunit 2 n=1 Tax=Streptosporangium becharense TaxID=1816182 RepID=A0A7W9ILC5_9ACTN|nr:cytochrome d ubiquinol oxidase subunit II [Streptosporangium becharense]MBB2915070.1 cytochrome bd-type quinol oxidase subunit 2 [Streptosporangium becharense]MBB5822858.1 cytochrome bd-type quinol oxidase subunit 2 [Streptosporangium becharense]
MDILWLGMLALLLTGYFALEGFDIGLGMLLPVLGRSQRDRDRIVAAMAPFVLANEVWLVAAAGVLFGAFPEAEGKVLFGLYPLVVALLVSWILRDAGLWFRRRADGRVWRAAWDWTICGASCGLALSWGTALVAMAGGLTGPMPVLPGLAGGTAVAGLFALHGRTFVSWLLPGQVTAGRRNGWALLLSACAAAAPAAALLAAAAPWLLRHAAPAGTLNVLSVMILPLTPLMVGAQVWVWRTFGPRRAADPVPSFF